MTEFPSDRRLAESLNQAIAGELKKAGKLTALCAVADVRCHSNFLFPFLVIHCAKLVLPAARFLFAAIVRVQSPLKQ